MSKQETQRDKTRPQSTRPSFDLQEVLKKARAEALGTLAPNSF